jgi:hypothetical protein
MEKILNDLNYCEEYMKTVSQDAKCCGGFTYEYITKCCNSAELNNVYEIVMKLFATNFLLTVDYNYFLRNLHSIMRIFYTLKDEEELFLNHTKYFDEDKIKQYRHLHIFKLYDNVLRVDYLHDYHNEPRNSYHTHTTILLGIFYKLYINNLIEAREFLDCFKGGMIICSNLNSYEHPLKSYYEKLVEANEKRILNIK